MPARYAILCALVLTLLVACEETDAAPVSELTVTEVAARIEAGDLVAVDANSAGTRAEHGVIPGARLLTSSGSYEPASELPSDPSTSLVFYCANTNCRASDGAAERARAAGYEDVSVMREGIAGWVAAGNPTAPPQS